MSTEITLKNLAGKYPVLEALLNDIATASEIIIKSFSEGNKLLICGNGGSSSDSDHIAGELIKGFENRKGLSDVIKNQLISTDDTRGRLLAGKLQLGYPAISLSAHSGLMTAVSNDTDPSLIFAQQVVAFGCKNDVLLAISTSGNSENVINAAITAKACGLSVIALTGSTGGKLKHFCDILINVPESSTAAVQELHLPVYHAICRMVEDGLSKE